MDGYFGKVVYKWPVRCLFDIHRVRFHEVYPRGLRAVDAPRASRQQLPGIATLMAALWAPLLPKQPNEAQQGWFSVNLSGFANWTNRPGEAL